MSTKIQFDVTGYMARLKGCKTGADFVSAIESITKSMGLDIFLYTMYPSQSAIEIAPDSDVTVSSLPFSWTAEYRNNEYIRTDPVVDAVRKSDDYCLWDCTTSEASFGRLDPKVLKQAKQAGLRHGITFPLTSIDGEFAFVSWATSNERLFSSRDFQDILPILNLIAEFFHSRARGVLSNEARLTRTDTQPIKLSPREREVLAWVAQGKSAWEIGAILTISQKTVELYINNAMKKLQAVNRTQAVVKAIQFDLIDQDQTRLSW